MDWKAQALILTAAMTALFAVACGPTPEQEPAEPAELPTAPTEPAAAPEPLRAESEEPPPAPEAPPAAEPSDLTSPPRDEFLPPTREEVQWPAFLALRDVAQRAQVLAERGDVAALTTLLDENAAMLVGMAEDWPSGPVANPDRLRELQSQLSDLIQPLDKGDYSPEEIREIATSLLRLVEEMHAASGLTVAE